MGNAFTELLIYVTDVLPDFLMAEPVVYFVTAAILMVVIGIVASFFRPRY